MSKSNNYNAERKKEGFAGQKMIVLPQKILSKIKFYPFFNSLYITDIGYFPKAKYHYRQRNDGIDQYIFIYCTEGKGWYELNNIRYSVEPDDFFIIPSGQAHSYGADIEDPWSIYWVHFDGIMTQSLSSESFPFEQPLHFSVYHIQDRVNIFNDMYLTLQKGYSLENIGYANSCLWHLLGSFLFHGSYKSCKTGEIHDPIEESISWMQKNLHKNVELETLANNAHFSVSYFSMLFNKKTGYSPIEYFIHLKMQRACQYLDLTEFKVKEIAQLLGYQDPYYFSRLFHKIMGIFPSEYRKKEKG